jgi:hypothetical protein
MSAHKPVKLAWGECRSRDRHSAPAVRRKLRFRREARIFTRSPLNREAIQGERDLR